MSQLPGYSVDDDTHDVNDDTRNDTVTTEPERADQPVSAASAGDAVPSATTVSSPTPSSISTQPRSTPPSQQEQGEQRPPAAATATALPQPAVGEFADPKISQLHAIFPDFDAAILYSVVDSVGGDQDRAVDALLAMSDPDHVPVHHVGAHEQPSLAEQTQLDEEFARRLLLEDEQQLAHEQNAQQQQQMRQFPYAQRSPIHHPQQANRGDTAQQPASPQRDTMTDVQEHISKLAETGKRTFSSLVSKVKAKVQEFDQTRNTPNASSSGASIGSGYDAQPPSPALDRHAQQAFYAPRVSPNPQPTAINDGFENPPLLSSSSDRDSASVPPVPATNSGPPVSNIDPGSAAADSLALVLMLTFPPVGKIGLLPKRPVSLVNAEPQPSHVHDEDEEELEYVENPFEEGKYS